MRNPTRFGYALAFGASVLSGLNGSMGRYLLDDGLSPWRLTEMRSLIVAASTACLVAAVHPRLLRLARDQIRPVAMLAAAMTTAQALYFYATTRMAIGVALVLQYLYPLLILLWLRARHGHAVHRRLWIAMALSVIGSFWAVGGYHGHVDGLGVAAGLGSAVAFAVYMLVNADVDDALHPATLIFWSFAIAAVGWCIALPVWTFPTAHISSPAHLALAFAIGTVGTMVPFAAIVTAVRFAPAARVAIILTAEAVSGAAFAFLLHDETLSAVQVAGGLVVIGTLCWLQTRPADRAVELAAEGG